MDCDLECFDAFETSGQNEFDVVSLFRQAIPRIVVEEGEIRWVPLPSVAFFCEVKSRVDKGRLSSDLDKLSTLRALESNPASRFPSKMQGPSTVDRQIHCLVYDQASIGNSTFTELLTQSLNSWDMVLIVEENVLIVNEELPFKSELPVLPTEESEIDPGFATVENGLLFFILVLKSSIPVPMSVSNTAAPLVAMVNRLSTLGVEGALSSLDR